MAVPPDEAPIVIGPDAYGIDDIEARAVKRSQVLRHGTAHPAYSVDSNRLGVVGELATLAHLRAVLPGTWSVDWIGDAPVDPADVLVQLPSGLSVGLEVKTTRSDWWRRHGRIVGADQMYATTARAYVWCVAARAIGLPDAYLLGWSATQDMRSNWSAVTFTGARRASGEQTEQEASGYQPEPSPYRYDVDDVDVDEYELHAAQSGGPPDAAEGVALGWARNTSDLTSQGTSSAGVARPWQEGSEPLEGFGKVRELVRVNAELRGMGELPAWLRSQVRVADDPH
jgi:hypothetical protein